MTSQPGHEHADHAHARRGQAHEHGGHGHGRVHGAGPAAASDVERVGNFVRSALNAAGSPGGPLLEVGAGDGALAAWLVGHGVDVTAIDINPDAVARASTAGRRVEEADFLVYEPSTDLPPFRAVAFTLSLHHIGDVDAALARAASLVPGGVILLDEFGYERADEAAAAFFFDQRSVLAAAGLDRDADVEPVGDPMAAWARRYGEEHRIARGEHMLTALARRCADVTVQPGPHLARLVSFYLDPAGSTTATVARRLHDLESARIEAGTLPAVGLRTVGKVPSAR